MLVAGADAVGITVSSEPRVTLLRAYRLFQQRNVRLDGLGVDAGEERIHFALYLDMVDGALLEDSGENAPSGSMHRIDGELELGGADIGDVHKLQHGVDVGRFEVSLFDFRLDAGRVGAGAQLVFDGLHDGGSRRAAVAGLVLQSIPVPGIVAG